MIDTTTQGVFMEKDEIGEFKEIDKRYRDMGSDLDSLLRSPRKMVQTELVSKLSDTQ